MAVIEIEKMRKFCTFSIDLKYILGTFKRKFGFYIAKAVI